MSDPTEAEWLEGNDPVTERERMEDVRIYAGTHKTFEKGRAMSDVSKTNELIAEARHEESIQDKLGDGFSEGSEERAFYYEHRDRYKRLADALVSVRAERDAALAAVERGRNVLELLRNYAEDSIGTTHGMLSASFVKTHVKIALSELDGAPEPESRWEYRGRLQSCGYVAEGYISAEHAMNGLRVELEDHPYLAMDGTAIVERARVREWLPVEGESDE